MLTSTQLDISAGKGRVAIINDCIYDKRSQPTSCDAMGPIIIGGRRTTFSALVQGHRQVWAPRTFSGPRLTIAWNVNGRYKCHRPANINTTWILQKHEINIDNHGGASASMKITNWICVQGFSKCTRS